MGTRLFVGNLSYDTTEETLQDRFAADGRRVVRVRVMTDRETGRPRGFAFVDMGSEEDAAAAIAALDGTDLGGRRLRVSAAMERQGNGGERREGPRESRPPGESRPPREPHGRGVEAPPVTEDVGVSEGDWSRGDAGGARRGSTRHGERRRGKREGHGDRDWGERGERGKKRGGRRPPPEDDFDDDWE